jgi:hypothetical protein
MKLTSQRRAIRHKTWVAALCFRNACNERFSCLPSFIRVLLVEGGPVWSSLIQGYAHLTSRPASISLAA